MDMKLKEHRYVCNVYVQLLTIISDCTIGFYCGRKEIKIWLMIKNQYHEEDIKLGILSNFAVVWRAYGRGMNKDEQGCVCKPILSLLIFMIKCIGYHIKLSYA